MIVGVCDPTSYGRAKPPITWPCVTLLGVTATHTGQVSSADDWYLLGSGLVVTETSLDIYDHTRYNASYGTGPGSLLSWQRALAANLLAEDGAGWAELAALHNSGEGGGKRRGREGEGGREGGVRLR